MTIGEPGRTATGAFVTVLATYIAALVLGGAGGGIGLVLLCEGFLCSVGNAFTGAVLGIVASVPIAAHVAHRNGVRWWYTLIAYAIPASLLLPLTSVTIPLDEAQAIGVAVLAIGSPLVAIAVSVPLPLGVRAALLGVVAVGVVGVPLVVQVNEDARRDDHLASQVEVWRQDGLPLYAPAGRTGVQVNSLGVMTPRPGYGREAWYDLAERGIAGEARVWMDVGSAAQSRCAGQPDLGDGVRALGRPDEARTVCRTIGDAELNLWQDGSRGEWDGQRLIDLARDLQPTDVGWLEQHLRER